MIPHEPSQVLPAHLLRGRTVTFVGDRLFHPISLCASFRGVGEHEI
jgi:hypothetical protein